MAPWFWYAVVAAVLYGAHQIFTRLASEHIGDGLGGFVVEGVAALSILCYLAFLYLTGRWQQKFTSEGFYYSALTGVCVGAGTIAFFLLFQRGGPLSSVPVILAGGAAIMAIAGILFFREPASWQRLLGIALPSADFSSCAGSSTPRRGGLKKPLSKKERPLRFPAHAEIHRPSQNQKSRGQAL